MTFVQFPAYQAPTHCVGCRCFQTSLTWTDITTATFNPMYKPRHRKPGPAQ